MQQMKENNITEWKNVGR